MTPTDSLLDSALWYAAQGWHVFPCKPRAKEPLTPHGVLDATTDESTIRQWWARWPDANVGIATGAKSGIVVVDIDPRHGGNESLAALEAEYGKLPTTLTVVTGGRGRHFYYAHPGGTAKNATAVGGWPGIDLKADGGYVIAPPSIHPCGEAYAWQI